MTSDIAEPAHRIRPVVAGDLAAVYEICLRTANTGDDATEHYEDRDLPGHVWAGPYVVHQSEFGFVVADERDRPVGYVLGALDSRAFEETLEREWWPGLRARYPKGSGGLPSDRMVVRVLHEPPRAHDEIVADYPSHLHIDLLPVCQGRGHGRQLVNRLCDALATAGSTGVHLGVSTANPNAIAFYRATGFDELFANDWVMVFGRRLP